MSLGPKTPLQPSPPRGPLVTRSAVPTGQPYASYRQQLRVDFFCSCAYCSIYEAEATAISYAIDHYEPRNARPDLVNTYSNLMYACEPCNVRKGDRVSPPSATAAGYRFYRPDQDIHADHFKAKGTKLEPVTNVGEFTIESLDLNRESLKRLRGIRERLGECGEYVASGLEALRQVRLDQLPKGIRGKVLRHITQANNVAKSMQEKIDDALTAVGRSPLIDPDASADERAKERQAKLKAVEALYPGRYRAPRAKRKRP